MKKKKSVFILIKDAIVKRKILFVIFHYFNKKINKTVKITNVIINHKIKKNKANFRKVGEDRLYELAIIFNNYNFKNNKVFLIKRT